MKSISAVDLLQFRQDRGWWNIHPPLVPVSRIRAAVNLPLLALAAHKGTCIKA